MAPYVASVNLGNPKPKSGAKVSVRPDRELDEDDWKFVRSNFPDLAMQMMRLRFYCTNMPSSNRWLEENCSGFYYRPETSVILFEKDDDAVLFKTRFEGSQR